MLNHIYKMLTELPMQGEHGQRFFDRPINVEIGAFQTFSVWGALPAPDGTVMVMDNNQQWHPLQENDRDALIMEAVYQRLRLISNQQQQVKTGEVSL